MKSMLLCIILSIFYVTNCLSGDVPSRIAQEEAKKIDDASIKLYKIKNDNVKDYLSKTLNAILEKSGQYDYQKDAARRAFLSPDATHIVYKHKFIGGEGLALALADLRDHLNTWVGNFLLQERIVIREMAIQILKRPVSEWKNIKNATVYWHERFRYEYSHYSSCGARNVWIASNILPEDGFYTAGQLQIYRKHIMISAAEEHGMKCTLITGSDDNYGGDKSLVFEFFEDLYNSLDHKYIPPEMQEEFKNIKLMMDVKNPLLGESLWSEPTEYLTKVVENPFTKVKDLTVPDGTVTKMHRTRMYMDGKIEDTVTIKRVEQAPYKSTVDPRGPYADLFGNHF